MSSNETPHVLVIGTGSIGERHTRCFLSTERCRVSICEINDDLRNDVANRYPVDDSFADLDTALQHHPDIAVICTPAHLHVSMAVTLLQQGIAVLCEKPLSVSLEGIEQLEELATAKDAKFSMAYVMRAHPLLTEVRHQVLSGDFGRPLEIGVVSGQHFPHYRPAYREIYYTNRATGGGVIQDGLTHVVNYIEWLVGPMTRVAADCDHLALPGVDIEDSVHVIARHGNVMAHYSMNQHQAPNEGQLTVICERGTIRVETHRMRWQVATEPETPWTVHQLEPLERDDLFVFQAHRFLDYVSGESNTPLCPFEDGLQTLRCNLAIMHAADTHTWVEV
ncbi:MAG: Gfo/Idh/MocA family oxidoreductase [Planctomycetota bacterium]|nr:Gfo/Idh/MocA family oxidoreductase [Planctomycetota bacterium]